MHHKLNLWKTLRMELIYRKVFRNIFLLLLTLETIGVEQVLAFLVAFYSALCATNALKNSLSIIGRAMFSTLTLLLQCP